MTAEQRGQYERDGYAVVKGVIDRGTAEELRRILSIELDAYRRGDRDADPRYRSVSSYVVGFDNVWTLVPALSDLSVHKKLADAAAKLTGARRLRLYHDALLVKMGKDSKPVDWHQDESVSLVEALVSAWLPLVPVCRSTGSITYARGSHAQGLQDTEDYDDPVVEAQLRAAGFEFCETRMEPGDVVFHNGATFHRTDPNEGDGPRIVLGMFFYPDGNRLRPHPFGRPIANDPAEYFPGCSMGDIAVSPLNPLVSQ